MLPKSGQNPEQFPQAGGDRSISLRINGHPYQLEIDPQTPLLWVLNEHLGLTGTKYSCGIEQCGACTVMIDGEAVLSCNTPVAAVQGQEIVTIEGLQGPVAEAGRRCGPMRLLPAGPDHDCGRLVEPRCLAG